MAEDTENPNEPGTSTGRPGLRKRKLALSELFNPESKRKVTQAEASRAYRARLKENSDVYKAFRDYENTRVQLYKTNMDEVKKAQYREKTRLRVQKCRAKQKAEGQQLPQAKFKLTRDHRAKQQATWRKQKAAQREKETKEEKGARNKKRRASYARKQAQQKAEELQKEERKSKRTPCTSSSTAEPAYGSNEALRKAVYRAKQNFPEETDKKVEVIAKIVESSTPKTKQMLADKMIVSPRSKRKLNFVQDSFTSAKQTLDAIRQKRNTKDLKTKRALAFAVGLKHKYTAREQSRMSGIGRKLLNRAGKVTSLSELDQRKRRKDAVGEETRQVVEQFYRRPDLSRTIPDRRGVKISKQKLISRKVMERSLQSAHEMFAAENPDIKLSCRMFAMMRPADVMPSTSCRRRDCLCEYCANIDLKLDALKMFAATHRLTDVTLVDKYDLSRRTLCNKGITGEYQRKCLKRNCDNCGTHVLAERLQPLTDLNADITFHKWVYVTYEEGDVKKRRMTRQRVTKPATEFIEELQSEAESFSKHLFDASWQGRAYDGISKNVPPATVVVCQDFAENFKCKFQDEAQGAHWSYTQVTLHASVASYTCPVTDCDQLTSEAMIFVSDDTKHDSHAVHHFDRLMMQHLTEHVPFEKVIFFSDGAPGQYKNKTAFADLSAFEEDYGLSAERHFFGSRHGKGPCDREFGTLKKAVDLQIKGRRANIDSAQDFFEFCQENYTRPRHDGDHSHYRRKFFFIPKADIIRQRPERTGGLKAVENTRQQHSFKQVEPFIVSYRERSCFCQTCTEQGECSKQDVTGAWKVSHLHGRRRGRQEQIMRAARTLDQAEVQPQPQDGQEDLQEADPPQDI